MTDVQQDVMKPVNAFYENVSGAEGTVRNGTALRGIFCEGATIYKYPSWEPTDPHPQAMNVDRYVSRLTTSLEGARFFERHGGGRVDIGLGVAQVWSRFESTEDATFAVIEQTGLNLFHLVLVGTEWKIASLIYEQDAAS